MLDNKDLEHVKLSKSQLNFKVENIHDDFEINEAKKDDLHSTQNKKDWAKIDLNNLYEQIQIPGKKLDDKEMYDLKSLHIAINKNANLSDSQILKREETARKKAQLSKLILSSKQDVKAKFEKSEKFSKQEGKIYINSFELSNFEYSSDEEFCEKYLNNYKNLLMVEDYVKELNDDELALLDTEFSARLSFIKSVKDDYDRRVELMSSNFYALLTKSDIEQIPLKKNKISNSALGEKNSKELQKYQALFYKLRTGGNCFGKGKSWEKAYNNILNYKKLFSVNNNERISEDKLKSRKKNYNPELRPQTEINNAANEKLPKLEKIKIKKPENDFEELSNRAKLLAEGHLKFSEIMPEKADGDGQYMQQIKSSMDEYNSLLSEQKTAVANQNDIEAENVKLESIGSTISSASRQKALDKIDEVISNCNKYLFWKFIPFSPIARLRKAEVKEIKEKALIQRASIEAAIKQENENKGPGQINAGPAADKITTAKSIASFIFANGIYLGLMVPAAIGFTAIVTLKKIFTKKPDFYRKYENRERVSKDILESNSNATLALERAYSASNNKSKKFISAMDDISKINKLQHSLQKIKNKQLSLMVDLKNEKTEAALEAERNLINNNYNNTLNKLNNLKAKFSNEIKELKLDASTDVLEHLNSAEKLFGKATTTLENYLSICDSRKTMITELDTKRKENIRLAKQSQEKILNTKNKKENAKKEENKPNNKEDNKNKKINNDDNENKNERINNDDNEIKNERINNDDNEIKNERINNNENEIKNERINNNENEIKNENENLENKENKNNKKNKEKQDNKNNINNQIQDNEEIDVEEENKKIEKYVEQETELEDIIKKIMKGSYTTEDSWMDNYSGINKNIPHPHSYNAWYSFLSDKKDNAYYNENGSTSKFTKIIKTLFGMYMD